jgi:hypothetical protein
MLGLTMEIIAENGNSKINAVLLLNLRSCSFQSPLFASFKYSNISFLLSSNMTLFLIPADSKTKHYNLQKTKKLNSLALVRERTISTERPPLVGEVSANFCG